MATHRLAAPTKATWRGGGGGGWVAELLASHREATAGATEAI